jgi:hypothetical protein
VANRVSGYIRPAHHHRISGASTSRETRLFNHKPGISTLNQALALALALAFATTGPNSLPLPGHLLMNERYLTRKG